MKKKIVLRIAILVVAVFFAQSSFAQGRASIWQGQTKTFYVNTAYWIGTISIHAQDSYSWAWGTIASVNGVFSLNCPINVGPCTKSQTRVGQGYKNLTISCNSVPADDNDSNAGAVVTW